MNLTDLLKSIKITEKLFIKDEIIFPIDIFPLNIKNIIENLIYYKRFNVDFISSAILSACSLAIGNKADFTHNGYTNKPIFWTFLVGYSGINKTQPIVWSLKPFTKADENSYDDYQKEKMNFDAIQEMNKKELLEAGITEVSKIPPKYKKTVLNIFTPESLTPLHEINKNGMIINADELTGFLESFNQYRKGGDQEFYITLWNGLSAATDRVSKNLLLKNPFVNIIGGIQFSKLNLLSAAHRNADGFIYRFLPTIPNITKEEYPNEETMPKNVTEYYDKFIFDLLNLQTDFFEDGIRHYEINDKAKVIFRAYTHTITDLKNKAIQDKNDQLQGILSKMIIYFYRFSVLLQIINDLHNNCTDNLTIFDYSVTGAQQLTDYYIAMHQRLGKLTMECSIDEKGKQIINDKSVAKFLKEEKKLSLSEIAKAMNLKNTTSSVQNLLR